MAIDSKVKRASVLGTIVPDGAFDQGDRQTILDIYRGILAGEIEAASTARAVITFAEGPIAAIAFSEGSQAVIAFSEGDVAVITFSEGT